MATEILVVDDNLEAAKGFARLIQAQTQLECLAVDDPDKALELISNNPVKVVVLDQKMPRKSGTELSKDIRMVDPSIRMILLSGEAEPGDVGEAYSVGFVDYLHKGQIAKLSSVVLTHYAGYHVDVSERNRLTAPIALYSERKFPHAFKSVNYSLSSMVVLDEEHVPVDKWLTIKEVHAGVPSKEIQKIAIEDRLILEESEEVKLTAKYSFSVPLISELKARLDAAVTSRYKAQSYAATKQSFEVSKEYKLPEEPVNPDQLHIVSRHYQIAPVYRRLRCILVRSCDCCGLSQYVPIVVYQLTSKVATKQTDYLSNGKVRELSTGVSVRV
ncbi:MAG: two-component system, OmpR family, response regulator [Blastocatellia bacterium]|jgi:CheY-like chemotaxis protein|nr:two-component system, OmpR family, response regulator [Blastocatellia bacterium]